jgi:hypothetical protein
LAASTWPCAHAHGIGCLWPLDWLTGTSRPHSLRGEREIIEVRERENEERETELGSGVRPWRPATRSRPRVAAQLGCGSSRAAVKEKGEQERASEQGRGRGMEMERRSAVGSGAVLRRLASAAVLGFRRRRAADGGGLHLATLVRRPRRRRHLDSKAPAVASDARRACGERGSGGWAAAGPSMALARWPSTAERRPGRPWLQRGGLRWLSGDSAVHGSARWPSTAERRLGRPWLSTAVLGYP